MHGYKLLEEDYCTIRLPNMFFLVFLLCIICLEQEQVICHQIANRGLNDFNLRTLSLIRLNNSILSHKKCESVYRRCEHFCAKPLRCASTKDSIICKSEKRSGKVCGGKQAQCLFRKNVMYSCPPKSSCKENRQNQSRPKCTVIRSRKKICREVDCRDQEFCSRFFVDNAPCVTKSAMCIPCKGTTVFDKCTQKVVENSKEPCDMSSHGVSHGSVLEPNFDAYQDDAYNFYTKSFHSTKPFPAQSALPSIKPITNLQTVEQQSTAWPDHSRSQNEIPNNEQLPRQRRKQKQKVTKYIPKFDYYPNESSGPALSFQTYFKLFLRGLLKRKGDNEWLQADEKDKPANRTAWGEPSLSTSNTDLIPKNFEPITEESVSTLECFKNYFSSRFCSNADETCQVFHASFSVPKCQKRACQICHSISLSSSKTFFYFCRHLRGTYCADLESRDLEPLSRRQIIAIKASTDTNEYRCFHQSISSTIVPCQRPLLSNEICQKGCTKKLCRSKLMLKSERCESKKLQHCDSKPKRKYSLCQKTQTIERICPKWSNIKDCDFKSKNGSSCSSLTLRRGGCDSKESGEYVVKVLSPRTKCAKSSLEFKCGAATYLLSSKCTKKYCRSTKCFTKRCPKRK